MAELWISRREDNGYDVKLIGVFEGLSIRVFKDSQSIIASLQRTFEVSQDSLNSIREKLDELISKPKGSEYIIPLSPEQSERLKERDLKS